MENYAGNSHRQKDGDDKPKADPGEKKLEKVIKGEAVIKKKGVLRKAREMVFAADFGTVVDFIVGDIFLPALRDLMVDSAARGTERLVWGGEGRRRPAPRSTTYSGRMQYNSYRDPRTVEAQSYPAHRPDQPRMSVMRRDTPEVILPTRSDAEAVLEMMLNYLDKYGVVALAELHELVGLETSHTDQKWGWTVLRNIPIRQVRDGYTIELPPMEEI